MNSFFFCNPGATCITIVILNHQFIAGAFQIAASILKARLVKHRPRLFALVDVFTNQRQVEMHLSYMKLSLVNGDIVIISKREGNYSK